MRRLLSVLLAMSVLLVIAAAPVLGAKPVGGCPGPFELMRISEFRQLSLDIGVPPDLLGADWEDSITTDIDRNDDDRICVQDLPDTPGTAGGWIFNVIDNTARR